MKVLSIALILPFVVAFIFPIEITAQEQDTQTSGYTVRYPKEVDDLLQQRLYTQALQFFSSKLLEEKRTGVVNQSVVSLVNYMEEISVIDKDATRSFINEMLRIEGSFSGDTRPYIQWKVADAYQKLGEYDQALAMTNQAATSNPESDTAWKATYLKGLLLYDKGNYEEALEVFKTLRKRGEPDPGYTDSLAIQTAATLFNAEKWVELARVAEEYLPHAEDDIRTLFLLDQTAVAYRNLADYTNEERLVRRFLDLHEKLYPEPTELKLAKRNTMKGALKVAISNKGKLTKELNDIFMSVVGDKTLMQVDTAIRDSEGIGEPERETPSMSDSRLPRQDRNPLDNNSHSAALPGYLGLIILLIVGLLAGISIVVIKRRNSAHKQN